MVLVLRHSTGNHSNLANLSIVFKDGGGGGGDIIHIQ